jgi:hypothetical protein
LLRPKQQFRLRSQPEAAFLEDEESFGSLGGLDRFTPASSRSSVLESAATWVDQSAVHSSESQTADDHAASSSSADPDVTSPEEVEYEYVDEEEEVEEEEEQSADVVVSSGINSKQFGGVPAGTTTAGPTTAGKGDSGDTGGRISQQEVNILFVIPSLV